MIPQNWTLSCFKKKSPLLTESKYEYNQNYIQCFAFVRNKPKFFAVLMGLGNRAEASLFDVAKGNLHKSYRRELQHQLLKRFIIHSALQLFFDWLKTYSESSKSAPVTSKLADYTIVMSRSQVIMSCMTALHELLQNNQGLGKGYQPLAEPSASADNPHLDLDYSGYHKNLIQ